MTRGARRLRPIAHLILLAALLLPGGCSRRDAAPPQEGSWYPEEILTPAERRDESIAKIERLTGWLRKHDYEGVLLSTPGNFAWITAGGDNRIQDSACAERVARLFFGADGRGVLIAPGAEASRLRREELGGVDYELHEVPGCEIANHEAAAAQLTQGKRVISDADAGGFESLAALRTPLSESEIRKYRWLGKRCGEVLDRVCRDIRPGMTERGIEALLSQGLMRHAITPLRIHVAADQRAAEYGVTSASEKTKVQETVIAGFDACRWGLVIGIARQVHFGPLPAGTGKASEAVSAVTAGFWARTLPGAAVAQIVAAAAGDYQKHGFTPAGLPGGAIGYGRERSACAEPAAVVESGQAFAWRAFASPAAAEDTILVVGDRLEVLTEIRGWPVNESRSQGRVYRIPAILTF